MRYFLFLVTMLFQVHSNLAHDLMVGVFEVKLEEDQHVHLRIRFDREDILKALYAGCDNFNAADACLEEYVNAHFQLAFEGQQTSFSLRSKVQTKNIIEVELTSLDVIDGFSSIAVFNDTLLTINDSQENIVRFLLTDKTRSFRMNRDRITTTVTY